MTGPNFVRFLFGAEAPLARFSVLLRLARQHKFLKKAIFVRLWRVERLFSMTPDFIIIFYYYYLFLLYKYFFVSGPLFLATLF